MYGEGLRMGRIREYSALTISKCSFNAHRKLLLLLSSIHGWGNPSTEGEMASLRSCG